MIEAIRYTSSLAQMKYRIQDGIVEVIPLSVPDSEATSPGDVATANMLREIIIPTIKFVDTPLLDALAFLEDESAVYDSDDDPNRGGVKFSLSKTGAMQLATGNSANRNLFRIGSAQHDRYLFTAPVKGFGPDRNGIYDLSGNVWEWCSDWYSNQKQLKVLRGGAWDSDSETDLLSSRRLGKSPEERHNSFGFRCVLELDDVVK